MIVVVSSHRIAMHIAHSGCPKNWNYFYYCNFNKLHPFWRHPVLEAVTNLSSHASLIFKDRIFHCFLHKVKADRWKMEIFESLNKYLHRQSDMLWCYAYFQVCIMTLCVGCSRIWESSYFPAGTSSARGRQGSRSNKTFVVYSKQFTTHRNINRVEDIPNSPLQASSSCCRVSSRTSGWTSAPSRWGCRPRRSASQDNGPDLWAMFDEALTL